MKDKQSAGDALSLTHTSLIGRFVARPADEVGGECVRARLIVFHLSSPFLVFF